MSYTATMKSVDTEKALALLELEAKPKGAYFNFPCPKCQKGAVIKAYGEKKNVWFCPECKAKGPASQDLTRGSGFSSSSIDRPSKKTVTFPDEEETTVATASVAAVIESAAACRAPRPGGNLRFLAGASR